MLSLIQSLSTFQMMLDLTPLHVDLIDHRPKSKVEALARFTNRLVVYNDEFENYDELDRIVTDFNEEINNELFQAI